MDALRTKERRAACWLMLLASCLLGSCLLGMPVAAPAADERSPPVMLANVYDADIDVEDYWVSEKYDGIRAYWDGSRLLTRSGNVIHAPDWFISGWTQAPMDGELWIGRGTFEVLSSTVRDEHPDDAAWRRVSFMVFDLPSHAGIFTQRLEALRQMISDLRVPWVRLVPQYKVENRVALQHKLRDVVDAGGEGLMLHRGSSVYRAGRSNDLLKLKPLWDAEAKVIAHLPGKGKYSNMLGALLLQRPDGLQFRLGSGFTDAERLHPPAVGAWVTYRYRGLTAKGIPRFAYFVRVREDLP